MGHPPHETRPRSEAGTLHAHWDRSLQVHDGVWRSARGHGQLHRTVDGAGDKRQQGKTQQRNWTNLIEYLGAHDVFNAFWTAVMHANPQTIAIRADHLRE